MEVVYHPEAENDERGLPARERVALGHAVEKLEVLGEKLGYPHSSGVKGVKNLRELRPRAGRSPWRAFYRRVSDVMVIGAVGPEAEQDQRGFNKAVDLAIERLNEIEEER